MPVNGDCSGPPDAKTRPRATIIRRRQFFWAPLRATGPGTPSSPESGAIGALSRHNSYIHTWCGVRPCRVAASHLLSYTTHYKKRRKKTKGTHSRGSNGVLPQRVRPSTAAARAAASPVRLRRDTGAPAPTCPLFYLPPPPEGRQDSPAGSSPEDHAQRRLQADPSKSLFRRRPRHHGISSTSTSGPTVLLRRTARPQGPDAAVRVALSLLVPRRLLLVGYLLRLVHRVPVLDRHPAPARGADVVDPARLRRHPGLHGRHGRLLRHGRRPHRALHRGRPCRRRRQAARFRHDCDYEPDLHRGGHPPDGALHAPQEAPPPTRGGAAAVPHVQRVLGCQGARAPGRPEAHGPGRKGPRRAGGEGGPASRAQVHHGPHPDGALPRRAQGVRHRLERDQALLPPGRVRQDPAGQAGVQDGRHRRLGPRRREGNGQVVADPAERDADEVRNRSSFFVSWVFCQDACIWYCKCMYITV